MTESHPPEMIVLSSMNLIEKIRLECPRLFHSAQPKSVLTLFVSASKYSNSHRRCGRGNLCRRWRSARQSSKNHNNAGSCPSPQSKRVSSCWAHGNNRIAPPCVTGISYALVTPSTFVLVLTIGLHLNCTRNTSRRSLGLRWDNRQSPALFLKCWHEYFPCWRRGSSCRCCSRKR